MPRIIHFEVPADDPERAARFYKSVFGWEIEKWNGPMDYWMVTTGPESEPGINGGIMRRMGSVDGGSPTAYVCTVDVDSLDAYVANVETNGGSVVAPKMAVPGIGWMAYCKDPEGNQFGLMQSDEKAA
ncbi:MAG: VOC family protein [Dehalococcoidia bacterium]|jgi:predicted enzyme related to lactoylglutathione lyase